MFLKDFRDSSKAIELTTLSRPYRSSCAGRPSKEAATPTGAAAALEPAACLAAPYSTPARTS